MKRWAVLTVALYCVVLVLVTAPALIVYGLKWSAGHPGAGSPGQPITVPAQPGWEMTVSLAEALEVYEEWGYWIWLAVMLSGQALLLLVPLGTAERRPISRRKLLAPVAVSAFFLALVFSGGLFSVLCAIFKDAAFEPFEFMAKQSSESPLVAGAMKQFRLNVNEDWLIISSILGVIALCWLVWLLVFYRYAKDDQADGLMQRATRWLVRGSVLELLVAVPSHIIVRRRDDCCAPLGTFWGIVTGLSIMLLAFGPGVFFLFVERFRRLRPRPPHPLHPGDPFKELK